MANEQLLPSDLKFLESANFMVKRSSNRDARRVELIKLVRVLYHFELKDCNMRPEPSDRDSRELIVLLLSAYGATPSKADSEILNLIHEMESIEGTKYDKIAEMDYLWGNSVLKIRNEVVHDGQSSLAMTSYCELDEDQCKMLFIENIPIYFLNKKGMEHQRCSGSRNLSSCISLSPGCQFSKKVASMLHQKYSQLVNDGLLVFIEKFLKDHFLPAMFVEHRKSIQQTISSLAVFRPRANGSVYKPLVENGRPVLQGLLGSNMLAKEVLGWAHLMPKYAIELVEFVQTFLERTYERCRTSYTEAVLEKQSYMIIGRSNIEGLMRVHLSNAYLRKSHGQSPNSIPDAETVEVELEISELLQGLHPIKQEHLIRDDHKLILLASFSDSLEYLADSVESMGDIFGTSFSKNEDKNLNNQAHGHPRSTSAVRPSFPSLAEE